MMFPSPSPSLSLFLPLSFSFFLSRKCLACSTAMKRVGSRVWGHTCAPHVHVCVCGWTWMARLPRYRSSSWPPRVMPYPLALHNNLPRRVCSGISARTLPPALLFPLPRPPSLLSLDRCYGRVFRPSFIHLFALRELGAVGVPFLAVRSLGDLFVYSMYCIMLLSILNWIIVEIKFYLNRKNVPGRWAKIVIFLIEDSIND